MGYDPVALPSKLKKRAAACLLAWLAGAALAAGAEFGADLQEVRGLHWPRFDPKTGKRIWDVTAEKAWSENDNTFRVSRPTVVLYGSEYKIDVASEAGVVTREGRRNTAFVLEGGVTIRISDPAHTVVKTEKLEWIASKRILQSDSHVEIQRTDLTVSGVGLELKPEERDKEIRFIRLKKDVKAEISPRASASAILSTITGKAEADGAKEEDAPPLFISSRGPMTINRDTNVVSFEEKVEVRRRSFTIRCDKLEMSFDPETRRVKDIHGSGNVKAFDGENGACGDALSWDALSGLVEFVGSPAKSYRSEATVSAPVIWFSQKDGKILWTGRVHLYAPPEGPASLLRFGAGD